jgi:tetratricopeptide (TPR) repeat protein
MPKTIARMARGAFAAAFIAGAAAAASGTSLSGAYLAAMQAEARNDYVAAARYYGEALARDEGNPGLTQNAIVSNVALGDIPAALSLAESMAEIMPEHQIAMMVRLADALSKDDFDRAQALVEAAGESINPLLGGLVAGWIEVGRGDFAAAQAKFDAMDRNDALAAYGQYHKALALALAGDFVQAETILAGGENGPLHVSRDGMMAHAEILAQIAREDEAVSLLDEALAEGFPDARMSDLREKLLAGDEVVFDTVTSARDGAADAFLALGDALNAQDAGRIALIHARLASHVRPDLVEASLLAADILAAEEQFELASAALAEVDPASPWYVTTELRRADTQNAAGEEEASIATLQALAAGHPDQIEVHSALGDALRGAERYGESAEAYTRAIELIDSPQRIHWVLFYTRGIAFERSDQWEAAEADFRTALELEPDQPLVLNYLGYSMVEQKRNLDEALEMIERAVKGQQDDGYITDSLGWVLYRMGRYEEAVPHMLRAVELVPDDPVINDHLGDVLWKVGRKREADFQWRRALSLGPAEELDMDRVRRKIEVGLDEVYVEEDAESDG